MLPTAPILFLAVISSASARAHLRLRGLPGAVYHCDGINFTGNCGWYSPADAAECHDDGVVAGQANGAMSLGPDEDGSCTLFDKAGCKGNAIQTIMFPGLGDIGQDYASFNCKANTVNTARNVNGTDEANTNSNSTLRTCNRLLRVCAKLQLKDREPEKKGSFIEEVGQTTKGVFGGH